jgi:hypothetical protein
LKGVVPKYQLGLFCEELLGFSANSIFEPSGFLNRY